MRTVPGRFSVHSPFSGSKKALTAHKLFLQLCQCGQSHWISFLPNVQVHYAMLPMSFTVIILRAILTASLFPIPPTPHHPSLCLPLLHASRLRLAKMNEEMRETEGAFGQPGQYPSHNTQTEQQYKKCIQEFITLQLEES